MADNVSVKNSSGSVILAAADELSDTSFAPKVSLLPGDGSATPYRIDQAFGSLTETAPTTDTASSGLNGRAQRIAQRLTSLINMVAGDYETVAASQSDQQLGTASSDVAAGDYLAGVLIIPATTSPGSVSIKDGGGSSITVFTGGASSVSNLVPFFVPLGIVSVSGPWKLTTGSNVSAIGVGNFN